VIIVVLLRFTLAAPVCSAGIAGVDEAVEPELDARLWMTSDGSWLAVATPSARSDTPVPVASPLFFAVELVTDLGSATGCIDTRGDGNGCVVTVNTIAAGGLAGVGVAGGSDPPPPESSRGR
jgi:hypothetical protein